MAGESTSQNLPTTTEDKIQFIQEYILTEPSANFSTYGYASLDEMYASIKAADGFYKIITHEPKF